MQTADRTTLVKAKNNLKHKTAAHDATFVKPKNNLYDDFLDSNNGVYFGKTEKRKRRTTLV